MRNTKTVFRADVSRGTARPSPLSPSQRLLQYSLARIRPASAASLIKRFLGTRRIVCEVEHGRFCVDPYSHFGHAITRDGGYEADMCAAIKRYLPRGGVFADIGANEGFFSVVGGLQAGPEGKVIVVEPQSRLQPVIRENLRLNGIEENSAVVQAAVSNESGTASIHLAPDLNTGSSGFEQTTRYRVATEEVSTMTLGDVFLHAGVERVDLMKMDIEGFEDDAIFGARDLFKYGKIRVLALELHRKILERRGRDYDSLVRFLEACGYTCRISSDTRHLRQCYFVREDECAAGDEGRVAGGCAAGAF